MGAVRLSKAQARRFLLSHQNLLPPRSLQGKQGLLDHFGRVRAIQFDPVNVAGRNHEIALHSRVEDFTPEMLHQVMYEERCLVDDFDKNMCIYCVEDWHYFARGRAEWRRNIKKRYSRALDFEDRVREEVARRGPLTSADLELGDQIRWPWGETRAARAALEGLYFQGELVVHHKKGARKAYDLAERHIPSHILRASDPNPTDEAYHDWHVLRRAASVGLIHNRGNHLWLGISGTSSARRKDSLERLSGRGLTKEVRVEGVKLPMYMRAEDEPRLDEACRSDIPPKAAFIAPLDNLIWDRQMVRDIFNFDYTWEVYVPVHKRRYGRYVLPVLYGDRFVARIQPVRDRKEKALVIDGWWWEEDADLKDSAMMQAVAECVERFANFLGCDAVVLGEKAEAAGGRFASCK